MLFAPKGYHTNTVKSPVGVVEFRFSQVLTRCRLRHRHLYLLALHALPLNKRSADN